MPRNRMTMLTCLAALGLLLAASPGQTQPPHAHAKKLIEWGWDEPDTKFMRANISHMEQFPFDGLVFHAKSRKDANLSWEVWGSRRFTSNEFTPALDDLKATKFHRFTERFLRVNVTPGKVDWFDDAAWATVLNNVAVAAQFARQGGCKGLMFDVEQYEGKPFDYRQQPHHGTRSFAQYQQKVRQRGRQWIQAINKQFPDITILLTFGYTIAQPGGRAKDRSQVSYGLLADFLDGMLAACSKETTLVDAWESAYGYKQPSQFERAYQTTMKKALHWTAVPDKYRQHMHTGFGLWLDNNWRRKGWNTTDVSKNYFTPAEWEKAVRAALRVSDQFVWIYTEQPHWWPRQKLHQAYVDALARARKQGRDTKPAIQKLGTVDLLMVETTPVVFKDRLYRFEYVRDNYPANTTMASYFHFIDVAAGKPTPAFARGQQLGCALVEGDTVYVYGVDRWGGSKIRVFRSRDLEHWDERLALHLPGWELFNTSVCKANGRYVMAVEVGGPKDVVGVPFTIFFAESKDLLHWKRLSQECVYSKRKYTACPALRYLDGWFYMIYLEARSGPTFETHIVRSRDLQHWQSSRLNPVLAFSADDKKIANAKLTPAQRQTIAQAKDINNSDVDLCEFRGKTVLYYSWGNQQGTEFLAEAVYDGTLAELLRGYFPVEDRRP